MTYRVHPPFCVPLGHLRGDRSPAIRVHTAYARIVWRASAGPAGRLRLAGKMLRWIVDAVVVTGVMTVRYGFLIRRRTGKGVARQALDQLRLAFTLGVPPRTYYLLRLHDDANLKNAHQYLFRYETKPHGIDWWLRRPGPHDSELLAVKEKFRKRCLEQDLPTVALVMQLFRGEVEESGEGFDGTSLPRRDLFVKPTRGKGGAGAARWNWVGDDRYQEPGGAPLSEAELLEHLKALSRKESILVQDCLENHPEIIDLSTGALTTARILTCQNERGEPEPVAAVFRMAVREHQVVDNIHAGGIACGVDLGTGKLGRATALSPSSDWVDVHPTTGAAIAGRTLPHWNEALHLACTAHRQFDAMVVVGWDVAITESGPVLVEGNGSPCVNLIQRPHDAPLGQSRMGELLAHHLEKLEVEPELYREGRLRERRLGRGRLPL